MSWKFIEKLIKSTDPKDLKIWDEKSILEENKPKAKGKKLVKKIFPDYQESKSKKDEQTN
jgi:hypothetical protein